MDIRSRHRHAREHRVSHHAVVALRAVVGHEPLVSPKPMHALPGQGPAIGLVCQQLIEPPWGRAARERDGERPAGLRRDAPDQPISDLARQCLRIAEDLQTGFGRASHERTLARTQDTLRCSVYLTRRAIWRGWDLAELGSCRKMIM